MLRPRRPGRAPYSRLVPAAVVGWLADVDERTGGTADPSMVRLGLVVMRGVLLDLVATGDDDGVNAAAARYVALLRRERSSVGIADSVAPGRYQR